jgi:hypothetical protein
LRRNIRRIRFLPAFVAVFAAAMLAVSAPIAAQASSATPHVSAAKVYKFRFLRITSTVRTPAVPVAHGVRTCVTVPVLAGTLPPQRLHGWSVMLRAASGRILWKSPVRHIRGTVCSPVVAFHGRALTQISVTRGTIAFNVTDVMMTF